MGGLMQQGYKFLALTLLITNAMGAYAYNDNPLPKPSFQKVMYYEVDPKTGKIVNKEAPGEANTPPVIPQLPDEAAQTIAPEEQIDVADNKIAEDVRQAILNDASLQNVARNISLVVSEGNVTVVGIVNNQTEKDRLQEVVSKVPGVKSVTSKIFITKSLGQ